MPGARVRFRVTLRKLNGHRMNSPCRYRKLRTDRAGTGLLSARLDGYIGWAGEDASGLARYLTRFGPRFGLAPVTAC